ncbi:unnamed protein product [Bursaphelenchus xylophilus]|uniref:(pine wood nematode) hypothetical protein n=1 Tax=Bursaphelenchus xylophilus TaxID=6326 RepID=A0A1I7S8M0_BURXY|nr:unnamed protein product [Bursaphelenchus xylophilus]CAG9089512.1 unnamed protein product [Bursaphelenchus xylophilus]
MGCDGRKFMLVNGNGAQNRADEAAVVLGRIDGESGRQPSDGGRGISSFPTPSATGAQSPLRNTTAFNVVSRRVLDRRGAAAGSWSDPLKSDAPCLESPTADAHRSREARKGGRWNAGRLRLSALQIAPLSLSLSAHFRAQSSIFFVRDGDIAAALWKLPRAPPLSQPSALHNNIFVAPHPILRRPKQGFSLSFSEVEEKDESARLSLSSPSS